MSVLFTDEELSIVVKKKKCSLCKREQDPSQFGKASGANYLYHQCKTCVSEQNKIRKKLKMDHPLSDPSRHRCPICDRSAKEAFGKGGKNLKSSWVLDHDHKSGKFRGYICHNCNRALGLLSDSAKILSKAISYLENIK